MQDAGCALRTAQLHAKNGHPEWVAFLARNAGRALKSPAPTTPQATALVSRLANSSDAASAPLPPPAAVMPDAARKPEHLRTVEEWAECATWEAYMHASNEMSAHVKTSPMIAVAYVKIATEALKAYHFARAKRVTADIEAGRLKPVSAWHAVKSTLSKIAALISGIEEVASAANPENTLVARRALTTWKMERFLPELEKAQREADDTLAAAA